MSYVTPKSMMTVGAVFPSLGIIVVVLRFQARQMQKARLSTDDWLMIPSLILMIGMGVSLIVGVKGGGIGYPTPPPNVQGPEGVLLSNSREKILAQKVEYVFQALAPLALGFVKSSIICFYRRIFCATMRDSFDWVSRFLIGTIILWAISFFFAFVFQCGTNFAYVWAPLLVFSTECSKTLLLEEGYAISDTILDIILLLLPLPMFSFGQPVSQIWRLQMPIRRKFAVSSIFLLGALTVVSSIIRMTIIIYVIRGIASTFVTDDGDLLISRVLYWGMLEMGLAVVVACLPTLQSLLRTNWPIDLLQSIRSVFTTRLLSSQSHRTGSMEGRSSVSHTKFIKAHPASSSIGVESYAMTDFEGHPDLPDGKIWVQSDIVHGREVV